MHRVSKAFCAMGSCIITNDVCEGSLYNVATCSTYKIPNYPHALSTLYAAVTNELNCYKRCFVFKKCVSLPIRYDYLVIRLNG